MTLKVSVEHTQQPQPYSDLSPNELRSVEVTATITNGTSAAIDAVLVTATDGFFTYTFGLDQPLAPGASTTEGAAGGYRMLPTGYADPTSARVLTASADWSAVPSLCPPHPAFR